MSHAVHGHLRWTGHSEEFWQNMVNWRRKWQPTLVFLPEEPYGQYEKAKRYDTRRHPICYWGSESESCSVMSDCLRPHGLCTVHRVLQTRILEWVAFPFSRGSPNPGMDPRSPALQADSLPAKPWGKPKKTGVGSLFLLQRIFLAQELNWGLLHCRQILYQPSYLGKHGRQLQIAPERMKC